MILYLTSLNSEIAFYLNTIEQKGIEPLLIFRKPNEMGICGRFWSCHPPRSSFKGGSLIVLRTGILPHSHSASRSEKE